MSADWTKGAYKNVRQDWDQAETLAGDDKFKRALIRGLHNLMAQIEVDMAELREALAALRARGTRQ